MELKYDKSAEGAITQMKEKKYVESLKEYHGNLLLVGINYDKESKKHTCVIEKYSGNMQMYYNEHTLTFHTVIRLKKKL